jgi:hypothetical protein
MAYQVGGFDVCVQGFERLRRQSEFILCAYINAETTADGIAQQWRDDLQSCMRPDGFDYDGARLAIDAQMIDINRAYAVRGANPWRLEPVTAEDDGSDNPVIAFLYVETEPTDGV